MTTPSDAPSNLFVIKQDTLKIAWNNWDFSILKDFYIKASESPDILKGILNPSTNQPIILEDLRIRAAIVLPPSGNAIIQPQTSGYVTNILGPAARISDHGFRRIDLDNPEFLEQLQGGKYKNISPHHQQFYSPLNMLRNNEVLVLHMKGMSKDLTVAVGTEEEYMYQYGQYHNGSFMECEGFAVPYTDIEKFKI